MLPTATVVETGNHVFQIKDVGRAALSEVRWSLPVGNPGVHGWFGSR